MSNYKSHNEPLPKDDEDASTATSTSASASASASANNTLNTSALNEHESSITKVDPKRKRMDQEEEQEKISSSTVASISNTSTTTNSNNNHYYRNNENNMRIAQQCHTKTLFVGNLHKSLTDVHLQKLFQPYGTILRVTLIMNTENMMKQPKGYAFVEYESISSARQAIQQLNGRLLLKRTLAVKPAHQKQNNPQGDDNHNNNHHNVDASQSQLVSHAQQMDPKQLQKETSKIESKIEQLKRTILAKKRQRLS